MTIKERSELNNRFLGRMTNIKIDRKIGSIHPKHVEIKYPINYGYIEGVIGGDGEELDVYLLGVDKPVSEYRGRIIAVICRTDDDEDKLVAAPDGMHFSEEEIRSMTLFQEQFHTSRIILA